MSGTWDRDEAATFVETLFAKHEREIFAYLLRMMRDPEVAADMTQDAFIKAWRALPSFEGRSQISTWLHRIVVNACLMRLRTRSRKPEQPIEELLPPDAYYFRTSPTFETADPSLKWIERALFVGRAARTPDRVVIVRARTSRAARTRCWPRRST